MEQEHTSQTAVVVPGLLTQARIYYYAAAPRRGLPFGAVRNLEFAARAARATVLRRHLREYISAQHTITQTIKFLDSVLNYISLTCTVSIGTMQPLRIQLAEELLSFYKFLTTLHIPAEALKVPPAEGWPVENIRKHFKPDEKDETVIELLKILPYIKCNQPDSYEIWEHCVCNDFSGSHSDTDEPLEEQMNGCGWEPLEVERGRYLATIGMCPGRNGMWIFCDVRSGEIITVDFQEGIFAKDENPSKWAQGVKEAFRELEAYPKNPRTVRFAHRTDDERMKMYRDVFAKYGWPSGNYQKEECLAALESI